MPYLVANWKMNGTALFTRDLLAQLHHAPALQTVQVIICPPAPYLSLAAVQLMDTGYHLGAQDCAAADPGAYTGQIAAAMLKDVGCTYVIVGHSECRAQQGQTSSQVRAKAEAAIAAGLLPIICVGESLLERETGQTLAVIAQQLKESLPQAGAYLVAYEPVWAIGTGKVPTADQIKEVHACIHETAHAQAVLYGGSVNEKNACELKDIPGVDGFLVGGASMKYESFQAIAAQMAP